MEKCKDLPELTLKLADDLDDVYRLLEAIKPAWKKEEVTVKRLSGGASNHMIRCSHDSGVSITVRVRNLMDGKRDHEFERIVVKKLSTQGDFPTLLATFQNGFCYEYISGESYFQRGMPEMKIDENHIRLLAHQMAKIHTTIVPEFDYTKTPYFDFYKELLSKSKPWFEGCPSIEELQDELKLVEEQVLQFGESPLVLCHGDLHPANMVFNKEENKLTFMDWELTQIAPRATDIAYYLNFCPNIGKMLNIPYIAPDDIERKLCQQYLERSNELQKKPSPTPEEIDHLLREFKYCSLAVNLAFVIYFVHFEAVFSAMDEYPMRWQYYLSRYLSDKEELLGIKTLGHSST